MLARLATPDAVRRWGGPHPANTRIRVTRASCRGAYFRSFRTQEHPRLTEHDRKLLRALVDDPELFGLAGVLEPDRAERLRWRAQRMLDLDVILLKGVV
jgi:hypothetical protein